jgi:hypothetical protein
LSDCGVNTFEFCPYLQKKNNNNFGLILKVKKHQTKKSDGQYILSSTTTGGDEQHVGPTYTLSLDIVAFLTTLTN